MAEPISIQQLKDASLDVKSLEEVVNGDENVVVTTRLGETYPSVKGSISKLFENGGLPAEPFETKAQMEIDGAVLADGDYAQVTDDTVNNGLYVKKAGAWVKSDYDPLNKAINYVDVNSVTSRNEQSDLHVFSDVTGNIVATIDDKAVFNAQDFATPSGNLVSVTKSISTNEAAPLITQADNQGNIIYEVDNYGIPIATYSFFGVSEMRSGALSQKDMNKTGLTLDRMSIKDDVAVDFDITVSAHGADGTLHQRMPSAVKVGENKVFVSFSQFSTINVDGADGRLVGKFVTYDLAAQTASVGELLVIDGEKTGNLNRHPHFIELRDSILLIYNDKNNEIIIKESFDGCVTFSEKANNVNTIDPSKSKFLGLDSIVRVEGGKYKGRIVAAVYKYENSNGVFNTLYSDDDGVTWEKGSIYNGYDYYPDYPYLSEVAVAVDANHDLIFVFRNEGATTDSRYMIFAKSKDGGKSIAFFEQDTKTPVIAVQTSLKQIAPNDYSGVPKIISSGANSMTARANLKVKISYDGCKSWAADYQVYDGTDSVGYLSLLPVDAKNYAIVYEDGVLNRTQSIKIKFINLKKALN